MQHWRIPVSTNLFETNYLKGRGKRWWAKRPMSSEPWDCWRSRSETLEGQARSQVSEAPSGHPHPKKKKRDECQEGADPCHVKEENVSDRQTWCFIYVYRKRSNKLNFFQIFLHILNNCGSFAFQFTVRRLAREILLSKTEQQFYIALSMNFH